MNYFVVCLKEMKFKIFFLILNFFHYCVNNSLRNIENEYFLLLCSFPSRQRLIISPSTPQASRASRGVRGGQGGRGHAAGGHRRTLSESGTLHGGWNYGQGRGGCETVRFPFFFFKISRSSMQSNLDTAEHLHVSWQNK